MITMIMMMIYLLMYRKETILINFDSDDDDLIIMKNLMTNVSIHCGVILECVFLLHLIHVFYVDCIYKK